MNALNKFNTAKQLYREKSLQLEDWVKEVGWDSKTNAERGSKLRNQRNHKQSMIRKQREQLVATLQELVNSSSLDDGVKQIVNNAAHHVALFETYQNDAPKAFKHITGPRKGFEDPTTFTCRQTYQALKDTSDPNGRLQYANYRLGVLRLAHSLCAGLEPTDTQNQAILDYFSAKFEAANKLAKEIEVMKEKKYKACNDNTKKKKVAESMEDEDVVEDTRRLLNWLVLKEYDGKGNKKFVQCNVTGDQLTLTDIKMRKKGKKSKKRKRGRGLSLVGRV